MPKLSGHTPRLSDQGTTRVGFEELNESGEKLGPNTKINYAGLKDVQHFAGGYAVVRLNKTPEVNGGLVLLQKAPTGDYFSLLGRLVMHLVNANSDLLKDTTINARKKGFGTTRKGSPPMENEHYCTFFSLGTAGTNCILQAPMDCTPFSGRLVKDRKSVV